MRLRLVISYDGSWFSGYQRQKNGVTVQNELENALAIIYKKQITIKSAGRTDAGVHALCQIAHYDTDQMIPLEKLRQAINKIVAPHIYIKSINMVNDDFHARLSPHQKEYRYYISTNEFNPINSNYIYYYPHKIDINKLKQALTCFLGTKDFQALSKGHEKENTIRTIDYFEINEKNNVYEFIIKGNGFLRNMVRIIIAILLKLNEEKITIEDIDKIIEKKERKNAPWCVPANGLYLYNIIYK